MDEILQSSLPWELKAFICLASGLIVTVLVLAIPYRALAWAGRNTPLSPNVLSAIRLPVFWAGVAVHFYVSYFWGFVIVVFATALDRTDGKMAKAYVMHAITRTAKDMRIGEWLDPLIDKLTLLPLIAIFAARGIISPWLAFGIILIDVFGTLMRKAVVLWFKRRVEPKIKPWLDKRAARKVTRTRKSIMAMMRPSKASAAGKIKALLQALGLVVCMPYESGWFKDTLPVFIMFTGALFFGALSVLSRYKIHEDVDKVVDSANAVFSHEG
ncbi:MAG: CDP-alcohol phosphatidyltransferase family protein [Patescibacteria group bacterium]